MDLPSEFVVSGDRKCECCQPFLLELTGFDPISVAGRFGAFVSRVSQNSVVTQGLEQIATVSARSFFRPSASRSRIQDGCNLCLCNARVIRHVSLLCGLRQLHCSVVSPSRSFSPPATPQRKQPRPVLFSHYAIQSKPRLRRSVPNSASWAPTRPRSRLVNPDPISET